MRHLVVAIDGPSGAGKSTIARMLAKRFGFTYIDTGALYRAVALYLMRKGIDPSKEEHVERALPEAEVCFKHLGGMQRVFLNGEDVSEAIREHIISKAASDCSALPCVRVFLLSLQRDIAKHESVIMDGRDIGTVVLPEADIKIFLTADPEVRARRRYDELILKGENISYERVLADLQERDRNDENRAVSPLKKAKDAVLVNTTDFELPQSAALLEKIIKEKLAADR